MPKIETNIDFIKHMLDNVSFGGLFIDTDRIIKYCNRNIERIFNYPVPEILGRRTELLYADRREKSMGRKEIYGTLEKHGFHIGTARGMTKHGKEIKLQLSTFVLKPNTGAVIFVERIQKFPEKMGVDKERFFQHLLDSIPDMIYFKDTNNRFVLVNKAHAEALNLTLDEVIGKTDLDFFPRELAEKYWADDADILKTGKAIVGKIERAPRPDGGITYVSTTKMPHYDEYGSIIGTIGITRNITDQMIAEEELRKYKDHLEEMVKDRTTELEESNERLSRMYSIKSDFTSMVSHELRTPLTVLRESISLVEDETLGTLNTDQRASLNMAIKNLARLERLIDDALDFSKLEKKKTEFTIVQGDTNEITNQVLKSYETTINKKGLYLNVNLDPSLPLVRFDPDRLIQVLHNLINNAIKFTEKGYISVESTFDDKNVKVSIKDTGCGIQARDLARIFEKFEQITTPDGKVRRTGTGLGLAICKQIVEQLGGRIFVESAHGKGSTFSFTLPL